MPFSRLKHADSEEKTINGTYLLNQKKHLESVDLLQAAHFLILWLTAKANMEQPVLVVLYKQEW